MVPREVLLQLIPPRARVVAIRALERLLLQVDALVPHQVRLLHEAAPADAARVRPHPIVTLSVIGQLALLRGVDPLVRDHVTEELGVKATGLAREVLISTVGQQVRF